MGSCRKDTETSSDLLTGWGGRSQYQFRLGAPGLLSQTNRKQFRFVGGGGGRMGGVGWKGLFCFILLFVNLNCARKERNANTILILKNNPELNYNGAVNM